MKKIFVLVLFILSSCQINNTSNSYRADSNLSLLDRLRSLPGLRISGVDERNAQVYLRGQTSVMYYKEVLFYINGIRVGNYSSAYQVVEANNIENIKLLKSASQLSIYGADGRDGVILIKTKT